MKCEVKRSDYKNLLDLDYRDVLTISRLIDLHLNWQLRRYSESSSDLIVSAKQTRLSISVQQSRS